MHVWTAETTMQMAMGHIAQSCETGDHETFGGQSMSAAWMSGVEESRT